MSIRSTRYQIYTTRTDGSNEMIQCNSRRKDALKRAAFVVSDVVGWPRTIKVRVLDVVTGDELFNRSR